MKFVKLFLKFHLSGNDSFHIFITETYVFIAEKIWFCSALYSANCHTHSVFRENKKCQTLIFKIFKIIRGSYLGKLVDEEILSNLKYLICRNPKFGWPVPHSKVQNKKVKPVFLLQAWSFMYIWKKNPILF